MSTKKIFTPEEIKILEKNPYTHHATTHRIVFTAEGKQRILDIYSEGKPMRVVLREMGYDPDIIGEGRFKSIIKHIRDEASSKTGIHEGYVRSIRKGPMSPEEVASLSPTRGSIASLRNEVAYLRAEVEFLKKLSQRVISGKRDN